MSPAPFAKLAALARRYPRRQPKKESFFFRAANPESRIDFVPESLAKPPASRRPKHLRPR